MATFTYRAYDGQGRLVDGAIESLSREEALEALRRQGAYPVEISERRTGDAAVSNRESGRRTVSGEALILATRELSTLINAQLPLDEALKIVALQPLVPKPTRRVLEAVLSRVVAGASLSEALALFPGDFPEYYWRLVSAAERSGSLGPALDGLASHLERRAELARRVRAALLYPAILMFAAFAALTIVVGVLVPAVAPLFEDAGVSPPPVIAVLRAVQQFVASYWLALGLGAGLLSAGLVRLTQRPASRAFAGRFALDLPIAGRLIAAGETVRFSQTLAMLLSSGVPLLDALRVSARALGNHAYKSAVDQAADVVAQGGSLSEGLARSGRFTELALRLTSIGERTGQLGPMLSRLARIEQEALQNRLDRMMGLIAPILTLVIGLLVGGIILSVMSALTGLNDLAFK